MSSFTEYHRLLQSRLIRSGDIIALFPRGQGVFIAAAGAIRSRCNSEAVIKPQLVKKTGACLGDR